MEAEAHRGEGVYDRFDLTGRLPPADRPDADQWLRSEVDVGLLIERKATDIVAGRPSLKHRDERQVRRQAAQLEVVCDGPRLVDSDRQPRLGQHERLAHPVHRRRPLQAADLVAVAADCCDILGGGRAPAAMEAQLREAAGVESPARRGARQPAAGGEATMAHEECERCELKPVRMMGPEVEPHADSSKRGGVSMRVSSRTISFLSSSGIAAAHTPRTPESTTW